MTSSRVRIQRVPNDVRETAWRFLVGAGVGAIVGLVVGGIGGRVVMLVLRLASDESLQGVSTDDGFGIGRITAATFFLLLVTAGLGAVSGVVYVALRTTLPRRGRAALLGVVAALYFGADVIKPDGLDFTALDPKGFAVASFALLPGLAAFTIAVVVERLLVVEPWSRRSLTVVLALGALVLNVVLVAVAAVVGVAVALRRSRSVAGPLIAVARVVIPLALAALSVRSGIELWRDANEIL
jgi:hypothetical protein